MLLCDVTAVFQTMVNSGDLDLKMASDLYLGYSGFSATSYVRFALILPSFFWAGEQQKTNKWAKTKKSKFY